MLFLVRHAFCLQRVLCPLYIFYPTMLLFGIERWLWTVYYNIFNVSAAEFIPHTKLNVTSLLNNIIVISQKKHYVVHKKMSPDDFHVVANLKKNISEICYAHIKLKFPVSFGHSGITWIIDFSRKFYISLYGLTKVF